MCFESVLDVSWEMFWAYLGCVSDVFWDLFWDVC